MGRPEGDKVLMAVAALIDAGSKQSNVVARYGGNEFAILMPETDTEQAQFRGERLRSAIQADHFLHAHGVTASIGIATFPDHGSTSEEVLWVADSGMHLAKESDGNCVKVASFTVAEAQEYMKAYLGLAVKRMFCTGNNAFNQHWHKLTQMKPLLDTVEAKEPKDPPKNHSAAVSWWAAKIAMQMGLSEREIQDIKLAGIVHDIGMLGIPQNILSETGRLTQEEFEVMKSHSVKGETTLKPLKERAIERIVRHHHEFFDGKGYPDNLKGEQIPIGARVIAVAEALDTMVKGRVYSKARTVEEALAELRRCRGTQFDPKVVDGLVHLIESRGGPGGK
jgi:HD-GYP domain-containing protein (c-di-GMP phosphodiesterase class II)